MAFAADARSDLEGFQETSAVSGNFGWKIFILNPKTGQQLADGKR
jgi:hypothetical protein